MAEHRYGVRLKNKSPEASVLKILRRQFPELSIAELRSKITNHDYIYLSDMEKYDGEVRMAKLLCEYDKAGIETELFAEHRKDSSSWQTEPMSREHFYNILNSSQQTKREVSESIEYETEGFISPEAKDYMAEEIEEYYEYILGHAEEKLEQYGENSTEYLLWLLHGVYSGYYYLTPMYEREMKTAVQEEDYERMQRILLHMAKVVALPDSSGGTDHSGVFGTIWSLLACSDFDNIYRLLPEGLPLAKNGYAAYVQGTNLLLCLLYNKPDKEVYDQEKIMAKAEKFTTSKKSIWDRALVSCLLAVMNHDIGRLSQNLQTLCDVYSRQDFADWLKIQCWWAYGLLALAKHFWTDGEFAEVKLPEHKNFSQGYARWLVVQTVFSDEMCVPYDRPPLDKVGLVLKKPVAVTQIHQPYLGTDNPYLKPHEKEMLLDTHKMMENLLGVEFENPASRDREPAGLPEEELKKLQRYIGHNTDVLSPEQIIDHIEKIHDKTPLTEDDWEKLLIPACGNHNLEVLAYLLNRLENVKDIMKYMEHTVMGQEKRKEYLARRIEVLKRLMPYIPKNEKVTVLSETLLSAAWYGETEVVAFLIKNGADVHYQNQKGEDAFAYAREFAQKFGDDTLYQYLDSFCGEGRKKESVFGRLAGLLFSSKKGDRRNE